MQSHQSYYDVNKSFEIVSKYKENLKSWWDLISQEHNHKMYPNVPFLNINNTINLKNTQPLVALIKGVIDQESLTAGKINFASYFLT